ncbi:transcriptional regulator [Hylemonella gracilis str. Niagara R]|uniref:Transcriptional regulator n=1 Tax=Hylemonella gracilis str. Niagara R TaxID=1458275 RepID=A0A016XF81_9BURK|nr:TetR/AcrR family transcriptional regulator [Hylemonella gracilis]EYC50481.1 transcriptional regulator [Hylemonella gracilis str. Niagara R]
MSTSYHHGDLKAALLAHALTQLETQGLESLSMREMAKAIDVSHTAAYRHFADKRSLLDAVAVQGFETLRLSCAQAAGVTDPSAREMSARERLRACGLAYVRFGLGHPKLLVHMFNAVAQGEASAELAAAGAALFAVLRELVVQGQAQSQFRAGDPQALSHACWAMVHGLAMLLSIGDAQDAAPGLPMLMDGAATSLDIFLDGLARAGS